MHRFSWSRLRWSTVPNVLIVLIASPLSLRIVDAGGALCRARAYPARPRCQSPREESNLCARGRNPLLFQLSYGGKSGALDAPGSHATRGADGGGRTLMASRPPAS